MTKVRALTMLVEIWFPVEAWTARIDALVHPSIDSGLPHHLLKHELAIHIVQVADLGGEGVATTSTYDTAGTWLPLPLTTRGKGTGGGRSSSDREAVGETFLETQLQGKVGSNGEVGSFREGGRGNETAAWSVVGVKGEFVAAAAGVEQRVICRRVGQVLTVVI